MQTAMQSALLKAGLATSEQAAKALMIPVELKEWEREIAEVTTLTDRLKNAKVNVSIMDIGAALTYEILLKRGEHQKAYDYILKHLRNRVSKTGA